MIRVTDANGNLKTSGLISGSGTANYLVKWSATLAQQNSLIVDGITAGALTIQKTGTTARAIVVPDADIEIQGTAEVVSSNWNARNHGAYTAIATATSTDPASPSPGHEFTTLVRNGTITIGGTAYSTAGSLVTRVWHSGSWTNYVYPHLAGVWTWTSAQTIQHGGRAQGIAGDVTSLTSVQTTRTLGASDTLGDRYEVFRVGDGRGTAGSHRIGFFQKRGPITGDWEYTQWCIGRYVDATVFGEIQFGGANAHDVIQVSGGGISINMDHVVGNGAMQLASGTTKASGIAFGTDTFLYRAAANQVDFAGASASDITVNVRRSSGENIILKSGSGAVQVGSASSHEVQFIAGGAATAVAKTTGQIRFLPLSADPSGAETGDVYYNSTTNKLRVYNGAWVDLH